MSRGFQKLFLCVHQIRPFIDIFRLTHHVSYLYCIYNQLKWCFSITFGSKKVLETCRKLINIFLCSYIHINIYIIDSQDKHFFKLHSGRHRCVGETFAYMQIKTIWSVLLKKYKFSLIDGFFPPVNYSTMIHTPTKPIIRYQRR